MRSAATVSRTRSRGLRVDEPRSAIAYICAQTAYVQAQLAPLRCELVIVAENASAIEALLAAIEVRRLTIEKDTRCETGEMAPHRSAGLNHQLADGRGVESRLARPGDNLTVIGDEDFNSKTIDHLAICARLTGARAFDGFDARIIRNSVDTLCDVCENPVEPNRRGCGRGSS